MTHFDMSEREWLSKQPHPTKDGMLALYPSRGRLSREAHAALDEARKQGHTWVQPEKPEPKRAKQVDRPKPPTVVTGTGPAKVEKATEKGPDIDPAAIREWAADNGMAVSARGRISTEIRQAYMSAVAPEDRTVKVEKDDFGPTPDMVNPAGTKYQGMVNGKTVTTQAGNGAGVCMKIGYSIGYCDPVRQHPGKPHTILTQYSSEPIDVEAIRR